MFIIAFGGESMTTELERAIVEWNVGGVILFQRNLKDTRKVLGLNQSIQEVAKENGNPPLWIGIDQEGGGISYLWDGMVLSPGNMLIGATNSEKNAFDAAYIMGKQLRELGFNMNYAPDIDINNNPKNPVIGTRSFGEDPHKVSRFGQEMIKGYHKAGILAVGKHFPGHGDTELDSHLSIPKVDKTFDELDNFELLPFRENIEAGMEAIMTGHILFPKLDSEYPATLSSFFLTELLREKYQFNGLILTDSMEMHAISKFFGRETGSVKAVQAGADIILACGRDVAAQEKMVAAVEQAVQSGEIKEEKINEVVQRILTVKKKWIPNSEIPTIDVDTLREDSYFETMKSIAIEGITLYSDLLDLLPFPPSEKVKVISQRTYNDENYVGDRKAIVHQVFHSNQYDVFYLEESEPTDQEIRDLHYSIKEEQYVLLLINERRTLSSSWSNLFRTLFQKTKKIVVVSLWNPQILVELPKELGTYIMTYSNTNEVMKALKDLLEGTNAFKGKSPVELLSPSRINQRELL